MLLLPFEFCFVILPLLFEFCFVLLCVLFEHFRTLKFVCNLVQGIIAYLMANQNQLC